ncbi:MAG: Rieske 2Fe-2S domain-containing protein [Planctomycetaceae bacterium]
MAKKLSTKDILARARAEAQGEGGSPPGGGAISDSTSEGTAPAETAPAEEAVAAEGAVDPSIAQTKPDAPAGDEDPDATPAETVSAPSTKPKATPRSTKDILAAARAQGTRAGDGVNKTAAAPKSTAPTSAPKSTKDILAAARAQKPGGSPAPAAAKPVAKTAPTAPARTPAAKPAPKTGDAGSRPSVQEMLRAVREGRKPEVAAPAPVLPKTPRRPVAAKKEDEATQTRRGALLALVATPFALAWTLGTLATGLATLLMARFMMPNVLVEPPSRFKIGPPSDYPFGTVSTKWTAQFGVWVVHTAYAGQNVVYALASVCTHLGCTPNWLDSEQKFKCPCHGSGFYITGINFEGPAPRPLERVGIALGEDGMLEVDKSVKFQEELGQWEDPTSYVEIA